MADVEVGQVRRGPPFGGLHYLCTPFEVVSVEAGTARVHYACDEKGREVVLPLYIVEFSPLWPSEHEQWKDAKGYEVKT